MGALSYVFPLLGIASYAFALLFNYGAVAGKWFGDLDVGEVSDLYNVSLTPSGWTFAIWGIIYTWQAIWLIYVTYLSFKSINKGKLYFGKLFWTFYCVSNVLNGIWIAVWIMEEITMAMIVLILIWITLVLSAYMAHQWLTFDLPFAITQGNQTALDQYPQSLVLSFESSQGVNGSNDTCCCNDEKQLLYAFVLNGIPLYATWTTIATCINVSVVFKYELNWTNDAAVSVGLTILILNILMYWYFDFFKFRNSLRFTYTPYFVLIWAFLGVLTNYSINDYASSVVILILLIIGVIATVAKVILGIKLIKENNSTFLNGSMRASLLQANNKDGGYGNNANVTAV